MTVTTQILPSYLPQRKKVVNVAVNDNMRKYQVLPSSFTGATYTWSCGAVLHRCPTQKSLLRFLTQQFSTTSSDQHPPANRVKQQHQHPRWNSTAHPTNANNANPFTQDDPSRTRSSEQQQQNVFAQRPQNLMNNTMNKNTRSAEEQLRGMQKMQRNNMHSSTSTNAPPSRYPSIQHQHQHQPQQPRQPASGPSPRPRWGASNYIAPTPSASSSSSPSPQQAMATEYSQQQQQHSSLSAVRDIPHVQQQQTQDQSAYQHKRNVTTVARTSATFVPFRSHNLPNTAFVPPPPPPPGGLHQEPSTTMMTNSSPPFQHMEKKRVHVQEPNRQQQQLLQRDDCREATSTTTSKANSANIAREIEEERRRFTAPGARLDPQSDKAMKRQIDEIMMMKDVSKSSKQDRVRRLILQYKRDTMGMEREQVMSTERPRGKMKKKLSKARAKMQSTSAASEGRHPWNQHP